MKSLNDFPRVSLAVLPTPIQKLENISRILGTNVWIKRDDMTGIGLGGNKVRKLEFLLAEAKQQGAEIVFTTGGAQSNHAMLTAACAKKLGMTPILILKKRGVTERKGNQLLEYLMDTDVRFMDTDSYDDIYAEMDRVGMELGRPYYKIPCGGSNALGALGYVACVQEIAESGMHFDYLVCAEGSGGTHAGVALGTKLLLPETRTIGMMVDSDPFDQITPEIMRGTARLLEADVAIGPEDVHLVDMCGPGYAIASAEGNAAIRMMAENEGLFLDPVYTGKAFAGLIKLAREGAFRPEDNVLFLYSGGAGGLFAVDVALD
ncbi:1-aminocyclopropane-1-carboxylate deaminase/D-cysteine desulfhydrase [Dysosmobacter sp.]|uniref:1-aminocyclopropane-1-carboxylate deaminase/D-cysteine desulfhydrase n=1 Tax=Dysosmobacter sp. TaxID=2591382 RepID=UPI002A89E861|nr:D-cysteine desulfhydrase family protein [Dysosmobacter sp.]MDY3281995.1 D-cysteine desulfhydrase family protein [Dysosmobacter sp.]